MDELLETIDLDIDEHNELLFKVNIEGTAASPARVRLVCETTSMAYMFNGRPTEDEGVVQFIIPQMSGRLNEEGTILAKVEVLVDNRYFAPVQFGINFKKTVKVFAEAVKLSQNKKQTGITVSAVPVVVKRQESRVKIEEAQRPAVIANPDLPSPPKGSLKERMLNRSSSEKTDDNIDEEVLRSLVKKHLGAPRRKKR